MNVATSNEMSEENHYQYFRSYDVLTESCIYVSCNQGSASCASGWKSYKGFCQKSIVFEHPGGVEMLTSSDISFKCGIFGSYLANTAEFSVVDDLWLLACSCPASTENRNPGKIYFDFTG